MPKKKRGNINKSTRLVWLTGVAPVNTLSRIPSAFLKR